MILSPEVRKIAGEVEAGRTHQKKVRFVTLCNARAQLNPSIENSETSR